MQKVAALRSLLLVIVLVFSLASLSYGSTLDSSAPATPDADAGSVAAQDTSTSDKIAEVATGESSATAQAQALTMSGGGEAGALERPLDFQLPAPDTVLSFGAATVSIPLRVPPGRAGVAPKLFTIVNQGGFKKGDLLKNRKEIP